MGWSALWTDFADPNVNYPLDTGENRQLAWGEHCYNAGDSTITGDWLAPQQGGIMQNELLHDEDRIITNDLFVSCQYYFNSTMDNPTDIQWNYYIVLEEIQISPVEGILQQLKGIGQNIDS